jgi:hypothetical protein
MEAPAWLAPVTGALALGTAGAMVALHSYGASLPEEHRATATAEIPVSAERAWALLSDHRRRPEWRPNVARAGRLDDVSGLPLWRELDHGGDRFDFVVLEEQPPELRLAVARPEDIGMSAEWTWTVEPLGPERARVSVTEVGRIENLLVRGWWGLTVGPWGGIEPDLVGFARALGAEVVPVRGG